MFREGATRTKHSDAAAARGAVSDPPPTCAHRSPHAGPAIRVRGAGPPRARYSDAQRTGLRPRQPLNRRRTRTQPGRARQRPPHVPASRALPSECFVKGPPTRNTRMLTPVASRTQRVEPSWRDRLISGRPSSPSTRSCAGASSGTGTSGPVTPFSCIVCVPIRSTKASDAVDLGVVDRLVLAGRPGEVPAVHDEVEAHELIDGGRRPSCARTCRRTRCRRWPGRRAPPRGRRGPTGRRRADRRRTAARRRASCRAASASSRARRRRGRRRRAPSTRSHGDGFDQSSGRTAATLASKASARVR